MKKRNQSKETPTTNDNLMECVCRTHKLSCKEIGFEVEVKDKKMTFCCQKGFHRSLQEFLNSLKLNNL